MKRVLAILCVLVCSTVLRAASAVNGPAVATISSWSRAPDNTITVDYSFSSSPSWDIQNCNFFIVDGDGSYSVLSTLGGFGGGSSGTGQFIIPSAGAHVWIMMYAKAQEVYGSGGTYGTYVYAWVDVGVPDAPYRFHFPGWTNESGVPAEIRITQGGSPLGSPIPLQPGENLPPADYNVPGSGDVDIQIRYPTLETDGPAWFLVEESPTSGTTTTSTVTPNQNPTTAPAVTITPPSVPTAPVQPNTGKTVWVTNTPGDDGLDAKSFREGVDKIVDQVKKSGVGGGGTVTIDLTPVTSRIDTTNTKLDDIKGVLEGPDVTSHLFTDGTDPDLALFKPSNAVNTKSLGKLPAAPELSTELTASHKIGINFDIPTLTGGSIAVNQEVDFSSPEYSAPIAIFRGAMLVLVTLVYFLLAFYTVRSAFAGK